MRSVGISRPAFLAEIRLSTTTSGGTLRSRIMIRSTMPTFASLNSACTYSLSTPSITKKMNRQTSPTTPRKIQRM